MTPPSTTIDPQALLSYRSLVDVGVQGDDVRRRMHGARTTFVRVFEVHVDAPVPARPPGLSAGEVRIVGRPASEAAATGAVRAAAALADGAPLTGFSLPDLYALAPDSDALAELCSRLHDAGLEAIADTPLDSNAARRCSNRRACGSRRRTRRVAADASCTARRLELRADCPLNGRSCYPLYGLS